MLYSIIRSEQDTRTFLYLMSSNWFNSSSRSLTAEVISSQVISRYLVHLWRSQLTGWGGFIRRSQFSCSVGFVFPESRHISCFSMFNMLEVFLLGIFQTFCFPLHLWCFGSNPGQQGTDLFWPFVRFVQCVSTSELCSFRFCFLGKHKRSEWDELLIRVRRFAELCKNTI